MQTHLARQPEIGACLIQSLAKSESLAQGLLDPRLKSMFKSEHALRRSLSFYVCNRTRQIQHDAIVFQYVAVHDFSCRYQPYLWTALIMTSWLYLNNFSVYYTWKHAPCLWRIGTKCLSKCDRPVRWLDHPVRSIPRHSYCGEFQSNGASAYGNDRRMD